MSTRSRAILSGPMSAFAATPRRPARHAARALALRRRRPFLSAVRRHRQLGPAAERGDRLDRAETPGSTRLAVHLRSKPRMVRGTRERRRGRPSAADARWRSARPGVTCRVMGLPGPMRTTRSAGGGLGRAAAAPHRLLPPTNRPTIGTRHGWASPFSAPSKPSRGSDAPVSTGAWPAYAAHASRATAP